MFVVYFGFIKKAQSYVLHIPKEVAVLVEAREERQSTLAACWLLELLRVHCSSSE